MIDTNAMRVTASLEIDLLGSKGHMLRNAADEIERLRAALAHMAWCRRCSVDDWDCCDEGRKAKALIALKEDLK